MMKTAMWTKLSILAAAVVVGGACAVSACTVTTTSPTPVDGGGIDSGTDAPVTTDAGVDSSSTACIASCEAIGTNGATQITYESPACGSCDKCMATSCCTETANCFNGSAAIDGGTECEQVFNCLNQVDAQDGGAAGEQACIQAHSQTAVAEAKALNDCQNAHCGPQDGGAPACK